MISYSFPGQLPKASLALALAASLGLALSGCKNKEKSDGAPPPVDEAYYTNLYKDVGQAVLRGDVKSGAEHYQRSGHAESRVPSAQLKPFVDAWVSVLHDDAGRG